MINFKIQMMYVQLYANKVKDKLKALIEMSIKIIYQEALKEVAKWLLKSIVSYFKGL